MSGPTVPTRQRSLRDRLHGIGLSWQSKKSDSFAGKSPQPYVVPPKNGKTRIVESHGHLNPMDISPLNAADLVVQASRGTTQAGGPPPSDTKGGAVPVCQPKVNQVVQMPEKSPTEKKPLSRTLTQPQGTEEYMVSASDTLAGIAARFDTTPSELVKLNRLVSRLIFPSQVLYVPCKRDKEGKAADLTKMESTELETLLENENKNEQSPTQLVFKPLRSGSVQSPTELPVPSVADESLGTPALPGLQKDDTQQTSTSFPVNDLDKECLEKFLKISARHITDGQGVVTGILLVTPNAMMFDPNVSDPLVLEHGPESYGVVAPMNMVMRAAMYYDIAHMRVKHAPISLQNVPKPEVYYARDDLMAKDSNEYETSLEEELSKVPVGAKHDHYMNGHVSFAERLADPKEVQLDICGNPCESSANVKGETTMELVSANLDSRNGKECISDSRPSALISSKSAVELSAGENRLEVVTENRLSNGAGCLATAEAAADEETKLLGGSTKEKSVTESDNILCADEGVPLVSDNGTVSDSASESRRERMLKRLSYPMESITSYTHASISKIFSTSPRAFVDFSSGLFIHPSEGEKVKDISKMPTGGSLDSAVTLAESRSREFNEVLHQVSGDDCLHKGEHRQDSVVGYKNMVEEKPELFATVDKLIPRPAQSCDDPPLYLCLRMGRPVGQKTPRSSPVLSYGKKKMRSEYWFSIPRDRVDDLYNFFQRWVSHLYGDVDEVKPEECGFSPIDSDKEDEEEEEDKELVQTEADKEGQEGSESALDALEKARKKFGRSPLSFLKLVDGHFGSDGTSPSDWEVVSMTDAQRSPLIDVEIPLPDLLDASDILTDDHRKEICKELPARAEGYPWSLIYSTSRDGFSLKTLYREMAKFETPVILVVADTEGAVFGAFISCSLKISDHFYGTGESFLFTFHEEFKCYRWTGENMYFIKGNGQSLAIGAGEGQFGLWLDGDLYHGRSNRCLTFDNDSLSTREDFVVKALEVWGFV